MAKTKASKVVEPVTFVCGLRTLGAMLIAERFETAIPEAKEWPNGTLKRNLFERCQELVSVTRAIEFSEPADGMDRDYQALHDFWQFAKNSEDYKAIWERFLADVTADLLSQWMDAYREVQPARYYAPEDLQPGAPEDGELDPNELALETA